MPSEPGIIQSLILTWVLGSPSPTSVRIAAFWLQKENGTLHDCCYGDTMASDAELRVPYAELPRRQEAWNMPHVLVAPDSSFERNPSNGRNTLKHKISHGRSDNFIIQIGLHLEFAPGMQNLRVQKHGMEIHFPHFVTPWPWMSCLHPLGLVSCDRDIRIHTAVGLVGQVSMRWFM